ncbi:MAG: hypothetical protein AB7Q01_12110 [Gammaproteobacteria bacterium]
MTAPGEDTPDGVSLRELMDCARAHGEMTDTTQWLDNLERMIQVAWEIMTPTQRQAFREHADVLAIMEAAGQS